MLFTQYLHDEWEDLPDELEVLHDGDYPSEALEKAGRPFYEIKLSCVLDEQTGRVSILAINDHELAQPVQL